MTRSGLVPHDGLRLGSRSHAGHVLAHLRHATRIAGRADFAEEPHCRQLGIGREARGDDRFIGRELRRTGRVVPRRRGVEIARQLPRRNPVMHNAAAHAEALSDGGLREAIIEEMLK